jgi:hypothetical protein
MEVKAFIEYQDSEYPQLANSQELILNLKTRTRREWNLAKMAAAGLLTSALVGLSACNLPNYEAEHSSFVHYSKYCDCNNSNTHDSLAIDSSECFIAPIFGREKFDYYDAQNIFYVSAGASSSNLNHSYSMTNSDFIDLIEEEFEDREIYFDKKDTSKRCSYDVDTNKKSSSYGRFILKVQLHYNLYSSKHNFGIIFYPGKPNDKGIDDIFFYNNIFSRKMSAWANSNTLIIYKPWFGDYYSEKVIVTQINEFFVWLEKKKNNFLEK